MTRRSQKKYPALDPSMNLKTRSELIDYDYVNKLSDDEKAWLNKFSEEYVNAGFNSKKPSSNLHKTKKLRQECYNRNNARNRDIFTRAKAVGRLTSLSSGGSSGIDTEYDGEEDMLERLEKKLPK